MENNLFDILSNKFLWEKNVAEDSRFSGEMEEYKKLGISIENIYDFYKCIAFDSTNKLEEEMKDILAEINRDKKLKEIEKKQEVREKRREEIEKEGPKVEAKEIDDEDIDEFNDF